MQILTTFVQMLAAFANIDLNLSSSELSENRRTDFEQDNFGKFAGSVRQQRNHALLPGREYKFFPANYLGNRYRKSCEPFVISIGYNYVTLTPRPLGLCNYCCRVKLWRDIRITLYTKASSSEGVALTLRQGLLKRSGMDKNLPTVIFVHGFFETCGNQSGAMQIKNAYLHREESYNVIIVDWSNLSAGPWYVHAAKNTIIVADVLAKFIKFFYKSREISLERLHLIGFSLGAHVVGMTGKHLKGLGLINRITGLDPALPLYPIKDVDHRITKDDAEFVDIIHSTTVFIGYPISIGHADFYFNYGKDYQPGCSFEELVLQNKLDDYLSCSHVRAWQIYVDTVRSPKMYPAVKCDKNGRNCQQFTGVYMGFNASRHWRGDYFVTSE